VSEFLARLKQRKLVQWALAYLAGAWVLLQVLGLAADSFDWPHRVMQIAFAVIAVGFVMALVLAWYHGERGTQRVTGMELLILAVLLAIGGGLLWRYDNSPAPVATAVPVATAKPSASASVPAKSIAVLPFENLSSDKDNAYFSDGMQDLILTKLADIGDLKVISRTSTAKYASRPDDLKTIGQQLGVATILEGSVQKAGNDVLITVQLIDAKTDGHVWAQSYQRTLDNIFGVEGEVAGKIADSLNARLTGPEAEQVNAKPTTNPAAYDAYLRGLAFAHRSDSIHENNLNAIAAFAQAVKLDPDFALAWANLARAQARAYVIFGASSAHEQAANEALAEAVRLAPDAVDTLMAKAYGLLRLNDDDTGAQQVFERIRRQWPNNAGAIRGLAEIALRQGRWNESRSLFDQAIAIDPRNVGLLTDAADAAFIVRDMAATQRLLERALEIAPDDQGALEEQVAMLQASGEVDRAQKILDHMRVGQGDIVLMLFIYHNATYRHDYAPAITLFTSQIDALEKRHFPVGAFQLLLGDLQRHAGDAKAARHTYEQACTSLENELHGEPGNHWDANARAMVEAGLGNETAALAQIRRAIALMPTSRNAVLGPAFEESLARIQARFGDKDTAIAALEHLLRTPGGTPLTPALLRLDPDWDNLRGDPRFQALLKKYDAANAADNSGHAQS
jgi:TolB-like protein/tetratricopeptide (TPR) repeat protein